VRCQSCGNSNEADATFCVSCGASITSPGLAQTVAVMPGVGVFGPGAAPAVSFTPPSPPAGVEARRRVDVSAEALDYRRYVEMLCEGQGLLAQLAIRFYYVTGLKSYLVTHHDSFIVPNLRRDAAEICARIKQEMDALGYQELMTTYLHMRTEHIQTLPYLSPSVMKDQAAWVSSNLRAFVVLFNAARLAIEVLFGVFFLVVDFIKWVVRVISQSTGASIRAVRRESNDEMLSGRRLILASTYRHTRTYTYVRDVGPETYVGWFTHHEPLPGTTALLVISLVLLGYSFLTGITIGLPFVALIGAAAGVAYVLWFGPWLLAKLNAPPQPRYISAVLTALSLVGTLVGGLGLFAMLDNPGRVVTGMIMGERVGPDPFLAILISAAVFAAFWLYVVAAFVFFRALGVTVWHFDQFDAETHAKIVEQRVGLILSEYLEAEGYRPGEIDNILSQKTPGAGRYRRARA
jgi:hypothetical protein